VGRALRKTPWGQRVGERLAEALETHLSQADLARRLKVSDGAISTWVAGGVPDAWSRLRDVCREAHCSADWLLGLGRYDAPLPDEVREPVDPGPVLLVLRAAVESGAVSVEQLRAAVRRLRDPTQPSHGVESSSGG
jgi:transcriptional regulator with XRE-family HTH domain